jgi:hypothetical protein
MTRSKSSPSNSNPSATSSTPSEFSEDEALDALPDQRAEAYHPTPDQLVVPPSNLNRYQLASWMLKDLIETFGPPGDINSPEDQPMLHFLQAKKTPKPKIEPKPKPLDSHPRLL